jgi:hypothetical protein
VRSRTPTCSDDSVRDRHGALLTDISDRRCPEEHNVAHAVGWRRVSAVLATGDLAPAIVATLAGKSQDAVLGRPAPVTTASYPSSVSSIAFSRFRSFVVARLMARSITGVATLENPAGVPRLRSDIRVAPSVVGSQV